MSLVTNAFWGLKWAPDITRLNSKDTFLRGLASWQAGRCRRRCPGTPLAPRSRGDATGDRHWYSAAERAPALKRKELCLCNLHEAILYISLPITIINSITNILFSSSISTVSCIHICNCNMYDSSLDTPILITAPP